MSEAEIIPFCVCVRITGLILKHASMSSDEHFEWKVSRKRPLSHVLCGLQIASHCAGSHVHRHGALRMGGISHLTLAPVASWGLLGLPSASRGFQKQHGVQNVPLCLVVYLAL
jgi:hypothetical protein